jgi:hypothetical protein
LLERFTIVIIRFRFRIKLRNVFFPRVTDLQLASWSGWTAVTCGFGYRRLTSITKGIMACTCHHVASLCFRHQCTTEWAFLAILLSDQLLRSFIIMGMFVLDSKFFACHISMGSIFALKAICQLADRTGKLSVALIECIYPFTIWCWAMNKLTNIC